jgi:hypothetical protein
MGGEFTNMVGQLQNCCFIQGVGTLITGIFPELGNMVLNLIQKFELCMP